jgi:hypothetical protein
MTIALAVNRALLYERLKSHTAGAAVRAATGPGTADGVIPAHRLRITPRPARPFLCARAGVISGQSDGMRGVILTWWVYDDPGEGYARIDALIDLIAAAYPIDALAWGETRNTLIGQQGEDGSLGGLLMCPIQITYLRRA